jgi:hypothetical protein
MAAKGIGSKMVGNFKSIPYSDHAASRAFHGRLIRRACVSDLWEISAKLFSLYLRQKQSNLA